MRKFSCCIALLFLVLAAFASPVKEDEVVVFFPGYGARTKSGDWEITIRGWIFEWERRPGVAAAFRKVLGMPEGDFTAAETALYAARTRLFLVDAERDKKISIHLAGRTFELPPSDLNGHFSATIKVADGELLKSDHGTISFRAITAPHDARVFSGTVHLIEPEGISVVSDIDDTIKVSDVLDRKKLLQNTFAREFVPAPGMSQLYAGWATNKEVRFHYLSASPSQLFTPLDEFILTNKFPSGSFHLRAFDWRTEFKNHSAPKKHKPAVLESLLTSFPKRRFIMVGDSGESDPEIYAEVARKYPNQVQEILIRDVTNEGPASDRYKKTFNGIDSAKWSIFKHPDDLKPIVLK